MPGKRLRRAFGSTNRSRRFQSAKKRPMKTKALLKKKVVQPIAKNVVAKAKRKPKPRAQKLKISHMTFHFGGGADLLAKGLGVTKADLATTLGLPAEAFYRAERTEADKTQTRLREMTEILNRVEEWAGGRRQAFAWYRGQDIPALGDETAEALVRTGRANMVRAYLDQIAAGGFA